MTLTPEMITTALKDAALIETFIKLCDKNDIVDFVSPAAQNAVSELQFITGFVDNDDDLSAEPTFFDVMSSYTRAPDKKKFEEDFEKICKDLKQHADANRIKIGMPPGHYLPK